MKMCSKPLYKLYDWVDEKKFKFFEEAAKKETPPTQKEIDAAIEGDINLKIQRGIQEIIKQVKSEVKDLTPEQEERIINRLSKNSLIRSRLSSK